ncbi:MAG: cellulase family glycosylhydrolase [Firmicutes bacterium]|nr:cellulase family glycosylhydrolase [Bacillota bacterium]
MAQFRGVNLGGWFVLEKWMRPSLFEGLSGPDETIFCLEKKDSKTILKDHWETFITEKDIQYLASTGINSVRLPLPWWFLGEKPYHRSLEKIDQVIAWFEKYKLSFLLDLHTAPGCQNGFDNGGVTGQIDWPKSKKTLDLTIEKLALLSRRYGKSAVFFGIEIVNEPHWSIDLKLIQDFYLEAYKVLRPLSDGCIVFHDAFRPDDPSWEPFFLNNNLVNVAFDVHLYSCFGGEFEKMELPEIIDRTLTARKKQILDLSKFVKVIVGEWSLGLHEWLFDGLDKFQRDTFLRTYANAQLKTFEFAHGWYFWSYRIDQTSRIGWDFSRLVKEEIMPTSYEFKE